MRFGQLEWMWGLLLIPMGVVFAIWSARRRQRAAARFADSASWKRLAPGLSESKRHWRIALTLAGMTLMILAIAAPQWGARSVMLERRGLDIVIALDVSLSMLAQDVKPNRLQRAKREIADIFDRLAGDRVGLVVFAGDAFTQFPLTIDAAAARLLLDAVDAQSAGRPGTALDAAIRMATSMFEENERQFKVMILISDGEGLEGDPVAAAQDAAEEGVRIYTVGIGSPAGEPIPEFDGDGRQIGYKKDENNQVVLSRLDEVTLQKIALATDGRYYRASPAQMEIAELFGELSKLEKKELEGRLFTEFEERFQYFLLPAFLIFALELVIPGRRKRTHSQQSRTMT